MEKSNIQYGCLARIVRDGGFKIALIARFSAIPGHCTYMLPLASIPKLMRSHSHNCGLLNLRYEYLGIHACCLPFPP